MAFNRANLEALDTAVRDLSRASRDVSYFIRKIQGSDEVLSAASVTLDPAEDALVMAELQGRATTVAAAYNAAVAIFSATDPV